MQTVYDLIILTSANGHCHFQLSFEFIYLRKCFLRLLVNLFVFLFPRKENKNQTHVLYKVFDI